MCCCSPITGLSWTHCPTGSWGPSPNIPPHPQPVPWAECHPGLALNKNLKIPCAAGERHTNFCAQFSTSLNSFLSQNNRHKGLACAEALCSYTAKLPCPHPGLGEGGRLKQPVQLIILSTWRRLFFNSWNPYELQLPNWKLWNPVKLKGVFQKLPKSRAGDVCALQDTDNSSGQILGTVTSPAWTFPWEVTFTSFLSKIITLNRKERGIPINNYFPLDNP